MHAIGSFIIITYVALTPLVSWRTGVGHVCETDMRPTREDTCQIHLILYLIYLFNQWNTGYAATRFGYVADTSPSSQAFSNPKKKSFIAKEKKEICCSKLALKWSPNIVVSVRHLLQTKIQALEGGKMKEWKKETFYKEHRKKGTCSEKHSSRVLF